MALDLAFMLQILPDMIAAFWLTIKISLITVVASVIAGILLTAIRMMGGKISRYSIIAFVEFTRGAPPLVHISIIYFLLPEFGIVFNEFWTGVIALSLIARLMTLSNHKQSKIEHPEWPPTCPDSHVKTQEWTSRL